jgi:hypothetical protein
VVVLFFQGALSGDVMRIEFLFLEGCPNTSPVWNALRQALKELGWTTPVERRDLNQLSASKDHRAGFGAPTILVDGQDLLGSPLPTSYFPSCRYYPAGIPDAHVIMTALKSLDHPERRTA